MSLGDTYGSRFRTPNGLRLREMLSQ
ncbi:hypothetical protein Godav_002774 [Gossypium davidsonii]|uniref:Uncharacterized protein n=2 Tax=Gossypium TaxID=3633 RepID=A0A7J8SX77_GOSDV|nr:hypothetical protein [Gossypium davidsonii]MBA0666425.1 hypothetical protein [Gossypium klotzschianum]